MRERENIVYKKRGKASKNHSFLYVIVDDKKKEDYGFSRDSQSAVVPRKKIENRYARKKLLMMRMLATIPIFVTMMLWTLHQR